MGRLTFTIGLFVGLVASQVANAQLTLLDQFNPTEVGSIDGAGFDAATDQVWVYGISSDSIDSYTRTGTFVSSVNRPGESANDADLEFAPEALTLGATPITANTLLMINGETDAAEIYAADKVAGTVLATLNTSFGANHVVGGAYHAGRNSFFLVQDRQSSSSTTDSLVAEIDPTNGNVLNTFKIDSILADYTVNFGDIEVNNLTGNLLIVSSDETSIAEFTPTGGFVQTLALPAGVSSLSGIALDEARGEAWVTSSNGVVFRLGNIPEPASLTLLGLGGVVMLGWRRTHGPVVRT